MVAMKDLASASQTADLKAVSWVGSKVVESAGEMVDSWVGKMVAWTADSRVGDLGDLKVAELVLSKVDSKVDLSEPH